ncbi:MAG TPA: segregation/condensation protein A [Blastocatellia bacterium]|jgi:segregation and condensation protein A|nr:segregation/condensation protein A [Blastocatellia bacterium]
MAKTPSQKSKSPSDKTGVALAEAPQRGDEAARDSYRVKLEIFEGPLDLLLYLIKKDEIDIYDIPISHITEQYLAYLELMQELDISVAGDFLVMASTLIYIKSKMLLPPEPKSGGEEDLSEDPRAELVERLLEYQKFKSASQMLYSRGEIESACFTRGPLETDNSNPEVSATVFDILRVFRDILKRAEAKIEMEIARDEMTVAEKLAQIHDLLEERRKINVRELFEMARSKRELIITFLALLELVKGWKIYLTQSELFGDIFASKRDDVPQDIEEEPVEQNNQESETDLSPSMA